MFNTNIKLTLCRTCLKNLMEDEAFNIFNNLEIAEKLMSCSGLPVEVTDEYPKNVCRQCYEKIQLFYEFQKMCCESSDILNELIKTKYSLEEESTENNIQNEFETKDPLNEDQTFDDLEELICQDREDKVENYSDFTEKKKQGRPPREKMVKKSAKRNILKKRLARRNVKKERSSSAVTNASKPVSEASFEIEKEKEDTGGKTRDLLPEEIETSGFFKRDQQNSLKELEAESNSDTESYISKQESPQKRSHQCDRCSKSFNDLNRLEVHKKQHDGLPPYTCTFEGCERSFNRWHFYNKHRNNHKLEQGLTFKCNLDNCGRIYKTKSALNIHKRKYHNCGPELKKHMCEICGKVFKSSAVLNDHHYTHIDKTQLPFACEEKGCSKRYSNKEKLKIHKMRHAGIKNFSCPYCGMRKTTRKELKIHINYHTLERTWCCRFCTKVFNSAGNLKMHVRNIHERVKDFACRFCGRTFAKADTKKYHEMTHTGEKPHECKECGRKFVQPAALRTHRKVHMRKKENLNKKETKDVGCVTSRIEISRQVNDEVDNEEAIVVEFLSETN